MNKAIEIMRKALKGLLVATIILLAIEGLLWCFFMLSGKDLRIDPLPAHPEYQVVCPLGNMGKLCPDQGPDYERVHPEVFFSQPTKPRIIVIGESFVYGLGIKPEEAWPKRIAAHLSTDVEVLNFGRCGTYASRLIPIVEAAIDLQPTAIIIATGNNEHTMTSFFTGPLGRRPLLSYKISKFLGGFQGYGLLFRLLVGGEGKAQESFERNDIKLDNDIDKQVYAARRRPPNLEMFPNLVAGKEVTRILEEEQRLKELIFAEHLRYMVEQIQQNDIKVYLATLPQMPFSPPTLSGIHADNEDEILELLSQLQPDDYSREVLSTALQQDDKVAFFHYRVTQNLLQQNKLEEALVSEQKVDSWDLAPDATPEINQIIREVANNYKVPLIDLQDKSNAFALRPGDFYLDSVHVNEKGADQIGKWVAEELQTIFE